MSKTVADRIEIIRRHFDMNNVDLARVCGVRKQSINGWVNQGKKPGRDAMRRLRDKLGIREEWLIDGTGPMLSRDMTPETDDEEKRKAVTAALAKIAQLSPEQLSNVLRYIDHVVLTEQ